MSRNIELGEAYYFGLRSQRLVYVDMNAIEHSIISGDVGKPLLELVNEYKNAPMPDGNLIAQIQRAMAGWLLWAGASQSTDCTYNVQVVSTAPPSNASIRRAGRLLTMVHELHKAGYQRIRIAAGMAPTECHWCCNITTADNIQPNGWEPINWEEGVLRYSTDHEDRYFGWLDASGKNARQLAQMFIDRFPDMARKGSGHDYPYAGWFAGMLGAAENGRLPVFFADYALAPDESEMPPPPLGVQIESFERTRSRLSDLQDSTDSARSTQELAWLRLKSEILAKYDLPNIEYPLPHKLVRDFTVNDEMPFAMLLGYLQEQSRNSPKTWRECEPALDRLASLIAPDDDRKIAVASGANWWLEIGPVDLNGELVAIQRDSELIAAIARQKDGRLRVATFHPLDAKSASYLVGLGQNPHPDAGVCMRENNWEYALDCSAGTCNAYAADRGEAYLSYWGNGIGSHADGTESPVFRLYKDLIARRAGLVATELRVHCLVPSEEDVENTDEGNQVNEPNDSGIPLWRSKRQQRQTVRGRYLGCLVGGAVGDALGAPVEFMKRKEILSHFGQNGITSYAPAYGGIGTITDDTQMTMFTAEGLLRAWVRGCFKGITSYSGMTARSYLRWLRTQGESNRHGIELGENEPGWLFQNKELHSRRAPGNTCLSALGDMKSPGDPAHNDSKGCGGVMRIAPVGLFAWRMRHDHSVREVFHLGTELAALTHGHPTGALTGGVLAVLILALTDGASLRDAIATGKACLRLEPRHEETLNAIDQAEVLAASDLPHDVAISKLGQGWVAEEALAISIYCALVARSFKHGVILAVNHDGDSDSTGAIAGNLLGTMLGVKAIPKEWMDLLELRDVISELAEDLYAFRDWEIGAYSNNEELNQRIWRKYPGF